MRYFFLALFLLLGYSSNACHESYASIKHVAILNETSGKHNLPRFEELSLLDNKLLIQLPGGFDIMSKEMLAAKYPAGNRPTLVYTNDAGSINFAFNHTDDPITEESLPEFLSAFVQQFSSIFPQIQWYKEEITNVNGKDFIVMEFITPAVDTRIYNLMYVTELEGRMLMCSFNCMESQKSEWESKAKQSLNSVEIK